ncbi:MAG: hypothetical protein LBM06_02055 [Prevotellaceae bacterium]|jgi:hypothetical protein|nr:hypothetical protein [Prevotellaceae bacterium]
MKIATSFFYCLVLAAICTPLHAQETISSPYAEVKGSIVISEFHTLDKPSSAEAIFINALLWSIENREPENRESQEEKSTIDIDYDKKQYLLESVLTNPRSASRYRYLLLVKVVDNIITILASDITYEAETSVIKLVKRLVFEKLQPEKKPKHKEHLNEFATLYKERIKQLLEAITTNSVPTITHWAEIKSKDVVKGMNKSECLLAFGKPASVQKQGIKEEWMYDSYTYLFFENEIVVSLIK